MNLRWPQLVLHKFSPVSLSSMDLGAEKVDCGMIQRWGFVGGGGAAGQGVRQVKSVTTKWPRSDSGSRQVAKDKQGLMEAVAGGPEDPGLGGMWHHHSRREQS